MKKLVNGVLVNTTQAEDDEQVARETEWLARHIDTDDEIDLAELNKALLSEGSVLRGIVELLLDEINILRQRVPIAALPPNASLPVRTQNQVKNGIQAKMRTKP